MRKKSNQWLILELDDSFEDISYREIEAAIYSVFGEVDFFIPINHEIMGSYTSTSILIEGYAFVRDCPEVRQNLSNLKEQRVFSSVLCYSGKYQTIDSNCIKSLKIKLKKSLKIKFCIGSKVRVLDGVFKNLIGEVINIEDEGKQVIIKIDRISREIIAPIPSTLLEKVI